MAKNQPQQTFNFGRMVKKFFLSSFVVFTFIAYAIDQRLTKPDSALSPAPTSLAVAMSPVVSSSVIPTSPVQTSGSPTLAQPTLTLLPSATPNQGLYRDGTYTGPQVDAYYGLVEVQVTIQNGKIANVQFLQYPHDQRTSMQINSIAMPYLQQEAIQVQSA